MKTALFTCVDNAGRSQIAAAWFERLADPQKARAVSAGTRPAGERKLGFVQTGEVQDPEDGALWAWQLPVG